MNYRQTATELLTATKIKYVEEIFNEMEDSERDLMVKALWEVCAELRGRK